MFRRRSGQVPSSFDAGLVASATNLPSAGASANQPIRDQLVNAIAAARHQSRHSTDEQLSLSGQRAPSRTRVQPPNVATVQQPQQPSPLQQPMAALGQQQLQHQATNVQQQFSVFTNPLSGHGSLHAEAQQASQTAVDRAHAAAIASKQQPRQLSMATPNAASPISPLAGPITGLSPVGNGLTAPAAAVAASTPQMPSSQLISTPTKDDSPTARRTVTFEVAADQYAHDQQLGELPEQDTGLPSQQYVYDPDTGQLVRYGQGVDATRLARHYIEDWNTGEFFQLAQPDSGCFSWLRRAPSTAPSAWIQGQNPEEPSILRSLADIINSVGSIMAALGMFFQGLAGGLALLSLFMTYLQYATAGREGFLAYFSAHAQMVNRAFFSLISLSLVAAASRLAFDTLGQFRPTHLRLRLVDSLVLLLFLLAYICNLLATPIDDQLTYEARRDLTYWMLPLPAGFVTKVSLWQVLNLLRLISCGLAWALVCYRCNPYVMMMVLAARHEQAGAAAGIMQQGQQLNGMGHHATGPGETQRQHDI
eukprot:GHRR01015644.1.p1 GENE.GHRR01015644.1~~GHRR01015644.1.p1  ORF type:complete len:535 (+),score=185.66 GHRR01015644.1:276-1880(+)